jgi:tripartite-type tricarboxylate transporter receptor subunit TctC
VATISRSAFLLLVHSAVPANSVKELIALAKAKPNALNYGSGGSGSVGHLAAAMLNTMAGTQMVHVPYKGAGPALNDTLAGHINVYFNTIIASLQHLKGGKIRGLAVTSEKRSPLLPELPTIAESGLPGYEATSWFGLAAPAGTPRDMIARLSAEVEKAVKDPEIQQKIQAQGADPLVMSADQFGAMLKADITKWAKVVKDSGATVE